MDPISNAGWEGQSLEVVAARVPVTLYYPKVRCLAISSIVEIGPSSTFSIFTKDNICIDFYWEDKKTFSGVLFCFGCYNKIP